MIDGEQVHPAFEALDAAIARGIIEGSVRAIDTRVAALRANETGDAATRARRAQTIRHLEDCAAEIAGFAGPIVPLHGTLALPAPAETSIEVRT